MQTSLPKPSAEALVQSDALRQLICTQIDRDGALSFAEYMHLCLYAPNLGYYTSGTQKFGQAGDFITAPEVSERFGQCLANQFADILIQLENPIILEIGAGSGRLALDVLTHLQNKNALPERYCILEVSPDLAAKQKSLLQTELPELFSKIIWLEQLPENDFNGIIFGNEVLDALPVHCFAIENNAVFERTVSHHNQQFVWHKKPADDKLQKEVRELNLTNTHYHSEINLSLMPWIDDLQKKLNQGVLLFIDYGFPEREFYCEQRNTGTLMCHYRHHAHPDPFVYPGLQDITAHVDFTAVAIAADTLNLSVLGYTTQADFLVHTGIVTLAEHNPTLKTSQAVQTLTFPHEMGELFKVIALGKNIDLPLCGFENDIQYKL